MQNWDIFCRIVDNYGDIGVCWRLTKQLAAEHGKHVRLWIDDLHIAGRLIPTLDPALGSQTIAGVELCQWQEAGKTEHIGDVVIEAFACELPPAYLEKMAARQPVWINLEYLSAEPWVAGFHARESRHPTLPLNKQFFFPGFADDTGGLLREHDLITRRDAFQNSPQVQAGFRQKFGIPDHSGLKVSLFSYRHAPLAGLLQAMADSPQPVLCLVPDSGILPVISNHFDDANLKPGDVVNKGNLTLLALPFLSQDEYDRLLWLCDINFVRGEDSWVRATWAGRPMIWQPYRQQENTHLEKLEAFLDVYCRGLAPEIAAAIKKMHESWCSDALPETVWQEFLEYLPALGRHASGLAIKLAKESDLASKLVIFCGNPS